MAIIALKAWYVKDYEPLKSIISRAHDLRLSRNSMLKSALRADFLDDIQEVKETEWFERYLEGEVIEFYIEGSGSYTISNIDLISQEIYFTKREITSSVEPKIFFSYQTEYSTSTEIIRTTLTEVVEKLNSLSRIPLTLEESIRPKESPLRLSDSQMRNIRKSMLFVADTTAVTQVESRLIPSPTVCLETGYALHSRRYGKILSLKQQRPELTGNFPFDLPLHQELEFKTETQLQENLPAVIEMLLQRFNLFY